MRLDDGLELLAPIVVSDAGARDVRELVREPTEMRARMHAIGSSDAHVGLYVGFSSPISMEQSKSFSEYLREAVHPDDALGAIGTELLATLFAHRGARRQSVRLRRTPPMDIGTRGYGAMEAEGLLDVRVLRRVIRRHQPELQECYDEVAAAPREPVVLRLEIDPRGVVSAARAESDEVPAEANECARAAALTWTFPEAEGTTRVSAPFRVRIPGAP